MDRFKAYRKYREVGKHLNSQIVETIPRNRVMSRAKKLGMVNRGILIFDDEDETSVLFDSLIYDAPTDGTSILEDYIDSVDLESFPELEQDLLIGMQSAWFSLFEVARIEPKNNLVELNDLIFEKDQIILIDRGLSNSLQKHVLLATRLIPVQDFHMTSGVGFPFPELLKEELLGGLFRKIAAPSRGKKRKRDKYVHLQPEEYGIYFFKKFKELDFIEMRYEDV